MEKRSKYEKPLRIPFGEMRQTFYDILRQRGFSDEDAALSARLFTETSCDGVYSHGLNRFPRYIGDIDQGYIDVQAEPQLIARNGVMEQWDGGLGPGNLNAYRSMERAVAIARENGMGCVALRNTNHWMRGGTYGWQAADAGCQAMLWSNTTGLMPPWGGIEPTIGNNPMILALPRAGGHVVLDFAQSMYSFGKLSIHSKSGEPLPYVGGYDEDGNLTKDASAIEKSIRPLPAGLWKGSGLAIMLDLFATTLSGGNSTMEISQQEHEHGLSQVFIAIESSSGRRAIVDDIIEHLHSTRPVDTRKEVRYPGERTLEVRTENMASGIPVDQQIWEQVCRL